MTVLVRTAHGAALALAATLLAGCASAAPASSPPGTSGVSAPTVSVQQVSSRGRDEGSRGSSGGHPDVQLPAGWPRVVPLPIGTLTGTNSHPGGYAVALTAVGSASQLHRRVIALYTSHGFAQPDRGLLVFAGHRWRVTVALANRDHSASRTNVVVAVRRP